MFAFDRVGDFTAMVTTEGMDMAELNDRQERFCQEYIVDCNATQAAIRAGYEGRSAAQMAGALLKKHKIRDRIDQLLEEIKSNRIADATEVMETLTRVLRRQEDEHVVVTVKSRTSGYDKNGKRTTREREEPVVVPIRPRLSDVNKAAELLGKRYALFTDKVQLDAVPVVLSGADDVAP